MGSFLGFVFHHLSLNRLGIPLLYPEIINVFLRHMLSQGACSVLGYCTRVDADHVSVYVARSVHTCTYDQDRYELYYFHYGSLVCWWLSGELPTLVANTQNILNTAAAALSAVWACIFTFTGAIAVIAKGVVVTQVVTKVAGRVVGCFICHCWLPLHEWLF